MSRYIFDFLNHPDWDYIGEEDGPVYMFKVHVNPSQMSMAQVRRGVFMRSGHHHWKITQANRIPGPPAQAPLQPYKVWCTMID